MSFVLSLLAIAPALSQDEPVKDDPPVIYQDETIIDIDEGLQIEARVAKSQLGLVVVRNPPTGRTLVHLRKDFSRELKATVDTVK